MHTVAHNLRPAITLISGMIASPWIFYEMHVPRYMLGGDLGLCTTMLCVSGLAFGLIQRHMSGKYWLAELSLFIVVSPLVMIPADAVYEYVFDSARFMNSWTVVARTHMPISNVIELFALSQFTILPAIFGGISGGITILLDRLSPWLHRNTQSDSAFADTDT
jgi:hypothetical protein